MGKRSSRGRFLSGIFLAVAALLAACLSLLPTSAAGEGTLELLQVGWDGIVVPNSWTPVRVRVSGGTADSVVRVEVVVKNRIQTNPQATPIEYPVGAYGEDVALPAGVSKEVTLWVQADGSLGGPGNLLGTVRLTAGDQTLAEQKLDTIRTNRTPYWPLVGVLADSPSVARSLSQVELPVQGLPVSLSAARLSAADIPTVAERMDGLSALVVQGNAAAALTGEQRRAVQEWIGAGGHLLLAGGPDAARAASVLPSGSLPLSFQGVDGSADLSGLAVLARSGPAPAPNPPPGPVVRFRTEGGSLLAGTSDRPMAWRWGLGQGSVTLLAADPSLEPLATWTGTPALLQKALEPALPPPGDNEKMRYIRLQERDVAMRLQGAVEALPPEAFPDWRTIAVIMGGFALLVGPLLHLLLWRADRRGWIWLAVPAAALVVSGGLYYVGVGRDGRDVVANVVGYLQLDPDTGQSREALVAGFFAPTYSRLDVDIPGDAPVRVTSQRAGPFGLGGIPMAPPAEAPFHVVQGRDTRVEFDYGQYAMRSVALNRTLGPETGAITARLGLEEGLIKGTVKNDTPYPLEDAAVALGQSLVKLGSLAPGQTTQVVLDLAPPIDPFRGGYSLSWRLFGRPRSGSAAPMPAPAIAVAVAVPPSYVGGPAMPAGMPEQLEVPQDPETQRRLRLMDSIVNVPRMGPGAPTVPLSFLAFTRSSVGEDFPSMGGHPVYHLTLLEQPLHLDMPPGPFTLPAAFSLPEQVDQTAGGFGSGSNGTVSWVQINGGSVTYAYHPPLPARASAEALVVTTRQIGQSVPWSPGKPSGPPGPNPSPGPAEDGLFSVYNCQSAGWDPLPGGLDQVRLEPASPYIDSEGSVKIKVSAGSDRMVQFLVPELTVEGRVAE